jgi:hypothetical protein
MDDQNEHILRLLGVTSPDVNGLLG